MSLCATVWVAPIEMEGWTLNKLESSNWITWKFQMRHLLMAKGLWKYVDGSETLAEDATEVVRTKFRQEF